MSTIGEIMKKADHFVPSYCLVRKEIEVNIRYLQFNL